MVDVTYEIRNVRSEFISQSSVRFPTSDQSQPVVLALADGGFAVAVDLTFPGEANAGRVLDIYGADGALRFGPLIVDGFTNPGVATDAAMTQLTDGRLLITWTDTLTIPTNEPGIHFSIVDPATGQVVVQEALLLQTDAADFASEVVALPGGGWALVKQDNASAIDQDADLIIYDSTGAFRTFQPLNKNSGSDEQQPVITRLTNFLDNGNLAIAYEREIADGSDTFEIAVEIFTPSGTRVLDPAAFDTTGTQQRAPEIVALNDGGFAVAYLDSDTGDGNSGASIAFFDAAGALRGGPVRLDTDTGLNEETQLSITRLANGFVFVTYTLLGSNIHSALFDPVTMTRVLAFGTIENQDLVQDQSSVATLANGTIVTAWRDENAALEDGNTDPDDDHVSIQIDRIVRVVQGTVDADVFGGDDLFDEIHGLDGQDVLFGSGGNDSVFGGNDGDEIGGGSGVDALYGEAGDDVVRVSDGDLADGEVYDGGGDVDTLSVAIRGNALFDFRTSVVTGFEQLLFDNSKATSGTAKFTAEHFTFESVNFDPGLGDFVVSIDMAGETTLNLSGIDLLGPIEPSYRFEINGDDDAETITGTSLGDVIASGKGADTLDGDGGADTMVGGADSDTYFVDTNSDVIVEGADEGTADHVRVFVSYDLLEGVFVEFLSTTDDSGTAFINLVGNTLKQTITGNAGANFISDGGAGAADVLKGLGGDDTYRVYNTADVIVEGASEGANDTVLTNVSFDLLENVFVETLATLDAKSTAAINLFGNTLGQLITGNAGANRISDGGKGAADVLQGLGGNDTYLVFNTGDIIVEFADEGTADKVIASVDYFVGSASIEFMEAVAGNANINLTGNLLAQEITGNAGDNVLNDGGAGAADTLRGLGGNDTYRVFNMADTIVEGVAEGANDTVLTSVSFDLLENVFVETLGTLDAKSTVAINLFGNTLKQTITGNAGANFISDGGKGAADVLKGLGGNDTYRVFNSGDTIVEGASEGANDTVLANVSFDLLEGVHVETFGALNTASTAALNLYGNSLKQTTTGNAGKNIISDGGKGAADVLRGLGGNDTYRVYNSGTVVTETSTGGALDTVQAAVSYTLKAGVHVEALSTTSVTGKSALSLFGNEFKQTITGNAGANVLRGYDGDDVINAGAGDDRISGGNGNDTLAGNSGADTYFFSNALNGTTNVDTIKGFSGIDLISLNSAIFTKAGPKGALAGTAFIANANGKAFDASDRIIYEVDTGILRYDPDGTGAGVAIAFAKMDGLPSMNAGDFVIA